MRDYGKVFSTFWTSSTTRGLSEDGRILALYLLTSPHTTMVGAFRLPDGYVSEDLQWGSERVCEGFANLEENGFATRDSSSKWVFIHNYLDFNEVENPNQAKSAIKLVDSVPDSVTWKPRLCCVLAKSIARFADKIDANLWNRLQTLSKGFLNQEQEQEQDITTEADASVVPGPSSDDLPDRCPHQDIIDLYHAALPMCPPVKVWNPMRQALLRQRWREEPKRQSLDWWRRYFAHVAESDFLTGRASSGPNRTPFLADLEWLIRPSNLAKVIEGRYHHAEVAA